MDIHFPAPTAVNVTPSSNINSLLQILHSDERIAKRRKVMNENQTEIKTSHVQQESLTKDVAGTVKESENIPKTVTKAATDAANLQKIPTVVFESSETENNSTSDCHRPEMMDNVPEQREMNVDVVVRAIPSENETSPMASDGAHHSTGQYPRIDSLGRVDSMGRVHKNKEFLKRFLKDNGVRTLIKTKLDEIHRSPVYQSVLQGQPYITGNIEGPSLGQSTNKTCSVV